MMIHRSDYEESYKCKTGERERPWGNSGRMETWGKNRNKEELRYRGNMSFVLLATVPEDISWNRWNGLPCPRNALSISK